MIFRTEIIEYDLSFDKYRETRNLPLSYRLRLYLYNGELTLKKQYFKWGVNDNEKWDEWWICKDNFDLLWISIITRKFDDNKYMKELETRIFEIFYDESVKMTEEIKKEILKHTKKMNSKLFNQKKIIKFVDKFNRRRKLQNINKII